MLINTTSVGTMHLQERFNEIPSAFTFTMIRGDRHQQKE